MSNGNFRHRGVVVSLETDDVVMVSLTAIAACEGCRAKAHCNISHEEGNTAESRKRILRITSNLSQRLEVGDEVDISITYTIGMIAVIVTYIIPLFIFVGALSISIAMGVEEGIAALGTFAVLALYYYAIYLLRNRFERVVRFDIQKR